MTLVGGGFEEFKTILDFSEIKVSKNKIKNSIRQVEVLELVKPEGADHIKYMVNEIKVGIYKIQLHFYTINFKGRNRLKQYGSFKISIIEGEGNRRINLNYDKRFKNETWIKSNDIYGIKVNNLIDIILYLNRLNNLKCFL